MPKHPLPPDLERIGAGKGSTGDAAGRPPPTPTPPLPRIPARPLDWPPNEGVDREPKPSVPPASQPKSG